MIFVDSLKATHRSSCSRILPDTSPGSYRLQTEVCGLAETASFLQAGALLPGNLLNTCACFPRVKGKAD